MVLVVVSATGPRFRLQRTGLISIRLEKTSHNKSYCEYSNRKKRFCHRFSILVVYQTVSNQLGYGGTIHSQAVAGGAF
jgi:hypothetical protein